MLFRASPLRFPPVSVAALALTAAALGALALSAVVAACSNAPTATPESGACEAYVPPASFDATSPAVSFTKDVMPLINRSCAFTSCHGSLGGPTGGMYLGSESAKTWANIVGVASTIYPSMVRVKAGDAANSFLQHKIDGDACTLSACTDTCAELMPQGQDLMAENDRLTFRAWIDQGAVSDVPAAGDDDDGGASDTDAESASTDAATDASGSPSSDASGE